MIYPTRRAILLASAIAPIALLLGVAAPAQWYLGLAAIAFLLGFIAVDGVLGWRSGPTHATCDSTGAINVGSSFELTVYLASVSATRVEVAIDAGPLIDPVGGSRRSARIARIGAEAQFEFRALRRGRVKIDRLWIRWQGPFGLIWRQRIDALNIEIIVAPDIRPVREHSVQLLQRDASFGQVAQLHVGEGSEFEALAEYRAGMDRRSIDWKQSARHTKLLAKEFRPERNNTIMMAVDSGRAMSEPLMGVARVDRAVSAALLTSFVALRDGDRVGFFGFDSRPRVSSKATSGPHSFDLLQRVAANIDYSSNETNYTLAIATLAEQLQRRSLVVMFTDFPDTVSAELMLHAVGTLLRRHLVLFVVMREEELESVVDREPIDPADVTRAVTAASLLRERRLVIARLRRQGVHVLECRYNEAGPALLNAYLEFKRRSML